MCKEQCETGHWLPWWSRLHGSASAFAEAALTMDLGLQIHTSQSCATKHQCWRKPPSQEVSGSEESKNTAALMNLTDQLCSAHLSHTQYFQSRVCCAKRSGS